MGSSMGSSGGTWCIGSDVVFCRTIQVDLLGREGLQDDSLAVIESLIEDRQGIATALALQDFTGAPQRAGDFGERRVHALARHDLLLALREVMLSQLGLGHAVSLQAIAVFTFDAGEQRIIAGTLHSAVNRPLHQQLVEFGRIELDRRAAAARWPIAHRPLG